MATQLSITKGDPTDVNLTVNQIDVTVGGQNNINVEVTPLPTQTINIDRGLYGPQGPQGPQGNAGTPATVTTGTTTTGAAGTNASVINSGTASAAIFDFTIPIGNTGEQGPTGATGAGVASGGTTGQVLTKVSNANYDTTWTTITGTLIYQGAWNALTNIPALASGVGTNGYYYVVSVAGSTNLDGITTWSVGDWVIFNGTIWQKIDNTDLVTSVNGQTGVVTLTASSVNALAIASNLSDLNNTATARTNLGLGTAATQDSTAFATAAQGATADSALQNITSTDGSVTITSPTATTRNLSVAVSGATTNILCLVRNTTGETLTKGTVVYISGAIGQNPTVSKALATSDATSAQTLGMMTDDLANNSNGYVTVIGLITNINTSAYSDGQQLYLSGTTAGAVIGTKPYAPIHLVYVAVVEHAHPTQGKLFVKVQNGYELDELHNVSANNPSNGQTIIWNNSTQLWEANNLTAGTAISVTNGAGTITIANTAPDQIVAISSGAGINVTGTYPNFTVTNTSPSSGGTVTNVTGTTPVNSSGGTTPAISLASGYGDTQNPYLSKTANYILASPNGFAGVPTFRSIVASDIPILNQNTTGTASNISGGVANQILYQTGFGVTSFIIAPSVSSTYLQWNGTAFVWASTGASGTVTSITAGTGLTGGTITTSGTITIDSTVATLSGTQTLTNKRIDPRVSSSASASSVTPDISAYDVYAYTALAANLTINAPTGTPVDGDKLMFRILDNGTTRTLTWNGTYTVIGVTLPTSTTINKTSYVGCIYNANNTRWDVIAVTTQA